MIESPAQLAAALEQAAVPMTAREVRSKFDEYLADVGVTKLGPTASILVNACCALMSAQTRVIALRARRKIQMLKAMGLMAAVLLVAAPASAGCFASDVKAYCCPSACAVKHSSKWYEANDVLRGCMRGMGCSGDGATVFMKCGC